MMDEAPAGTIPLWDVKSIRAEVTRTETILRMAHALVAVGLLALLALDVPGLAIAMAGFLALIGLALDRIGRRRRLREGLLSVAVECGHPWHPAERGDSVTVHVRNSSGEWIAPPLTTRLVAARDPILGGRILRGSDPDEGIIARLGEEWTDAALTDWVAIVNQALMVAEAQSRDGEDPFEAAREREDTAEGLLDREWLDTTPGQNDMELGQLANAKEILARRRKTRDVERESDEEEMA